MKSIQTKFTLILVGLVAIGWAVVEEPMKYENGKIVTVLSYQAAESGIGISLKILDSKLPDYSRLPMEYRLAYTTGYLVILDRKDPDYSKLERLWVSNDYRHMKSPNNGTMEYFIPNAFFRSPMELDYFLDGKAGDEMIDYFDTWDQIEKENDTAILFNNFLISNIRDTLNVLKKTQSATDSIQKQSDLLNQEISTLEDQVSLYKANLESPSALTAFVTGTIFNPARLGRLIKRPYDKEKDFMRPVLSDNFVSIEGKSYDSDQISNKYLHKDLVEALDAIVANEEQALKNIGLWPFKLASASRTPLQQVSVKADNPIAVGMFSSGHVFGSAGDISLLGSTYNNKEDRADLKALLGKHGVTLPDGLSIKDPNHFFLTKFLNSKIFSNSLKLDMLEKYYDVMSKERVIQVAKQDKLKEESKVTSKAIKGLDEQLKLAQQRLDEVKKENEQLAQKKINTQKEVNRIKDAIAAKQELARRKNRGSNDRRDRERSWGGSGSDGYWGKGDYGESHINDRNRDCAGDVRPGRDGGIEGRSVECRGVGGEKGMRFDK